MSLLAQMSAHPIICVVMNLSQSSVLGLHVLWQGVSLDQRSIFPVHVPLEPVLPWFVGISYRVNQLLLLLFEEVWHLTGFSIENNSLKKLLIVDIPISILLAIFLIVLRFLKSLLLAMLHSLKEHPRHIIIATQYSIINDPKAKFSGMLDLGSTLDKAL